MKIGCEKRKEETTAEIETQTTFKCYTLVLVERGQTGASVEIFISFRASFEAAPLRIVATFSPNPPFSLHREEKAVVWDIF